MKKAVPLNFSFSSYSHEGAYTPYAVFNLKSTLVKGLKSNLEDSGLSRFIMVTPNSC